jgi:biopolymer transport protein ExbD
MARRLTRFVTTAAPFHTINLTPMVPVLLALFAVLAVTTAETPVAKLDMPPVDCFGVCEPAPRIFVSFSREGGAVVDGQTVSVAKAPEMIVSMSRERPGTSIAIRADADVPYAAVFSVFRAVEEAGLRPPTLINEDIR